MNRLWVNVFAAALAVSLSSAPARAEPFEFVAIGDMPYNIPGDYEKFDRLIDRINARAPAFTIHVGDIISGVTRCSDENFAEVKARFDRFEGALIYTPGDNEWTDCHRLLGGRFDPQERLGQVRRMFFPDPARSLGKRPIAVLSQAQQMAQAFAPYVENLRFSKDGVVFASAHVVGSLNNFDPARPEAVGEFEARNAANIAWIDDAFRDAGASNAIGLVLFWQANIHATPRLKPDADYAAPFAATINAVERGARTFGKPVLVIFGDFHFYEVSPFRNMRKEPVPQVTRLQVFGERDVHGVLVRVDPKRPELFAIEPMLVPENGNP